MKVRYLIMFAVLVSGLLVLDSFISRRSERPRNSSGTGKRISGAFKALNAWTQQRIYPLDEVPGNAFYDAFEYARANLQGDLDDAVEPWTELGPHNIGGRTLAIAFNPQNPNTMYAGSASGGLWRSYSGGRGVNAWHRIETGFPALGVGTITIAPEDSNVIYIGTGEVYNYRNTGTGFTLRPTRGSYGIGILKSTDGGATWQPSLDWRLNQERGVWAVRLNPLNANTVWAGTTEGVLRSYDAGESWEEIDDTIMVNDLIVSAADTNVVVFTAGNLFSAGHGLYRTADNGVSRQKIVSGVPQTFGGKAMLAASASNPQVMYASFGNSTQQFNSATWLSRSEDNGASWTIVSTVNYSLWQGWFAHDVAIHPENPDTLICIGVPIYRSFDGGVTMTQRNQGGLPVPSRPPIGGSGQSSRYIHVDMHDIAYHPQNPEIAYIATDGGVFRTTDGGDTFQECNGGYQTTQFYQGISNSAGGEDFLVGGLQDNGSVIYDGSLAHLRVFGGDGSFTAIALDNPKIVYVSYQELNMARSLDGGLSFIFLNGPPAVGSVAFIAPFVLGRQSSSTLYAGRSIVYKSANSGFNWVATNGGAELDGNPVIAFAISRQSDDVLYASTAPINGRGNVFVTRDGGLTWDNITGPLPDRFPVDLAVDPDDDATVYVTFSGFGTSHLYRSRDGGSSWDDIGAGLPDVPTNAVFIDPSIPEHIYVGNDLGVFVSVDGGATWERFGADLPSATIAMDFGFSADLENRYLRVATHGNGLYQRPLLPATVTSVAENPPVVRAFSLAQNYPNPFNPETTISFSLPEAGEVELGIFDVSGREITTLMRAYREAGDHVIVWDGRDAQGAAAASGVYFYTLRTGDRIATRKMTLLK